MNEYQEGYDQAIIDIYEVIIDPLKECLRQYSVTNTKSSFILDIQEILGDY